MKKVEIKETREVVVGTEFHADDGTVFYCEEECKKYEESAECVLAARLKKVGECTQDSLNECGSDDEVVEVYRLDTDDDVKNLCQYLEVKYGSNHGTVVNLSKLHANSTVMIWLNYDGDWYWFFGDGTIESYLEETRKNYNNALGLMKG